LVTLGELGAATEQLHELGNHLGRPVELGNDPIERCVRQDDALMILHDLGGPRGDGVEYERGDGRVLEVGGLADEGILLRGDADLDTVAARLLG
jgi:hypothetical protein